MQSQFQIEQLESDLRYFPVILYYLIVQFFFYNKGLPETTLRMRNLMLTSFKSSLIDFRASEGDFLIEIIVI